MDEGSPYIVMEYLDGADLWHVVHGGSGPLPIADATGYVLQACEALGEAHALGIIHRDLKPQNLFLVRRPDGRPCVKVLDFGISKMLTQTSQPPLTLTRTSTIIGSPLYMAPEQMRSAKAANEKSDIWSLGVILYELLTGRTPFMAETMPDLVFKVAQDAIIPPRDLRAEIPETLSVAVLKCLERNIDNRYVNVAELAAVLEKYAPDYQRGTSDRISAVLRVPSVPPPLSVMTQKLEPPAAAVTGNSSWGKTHAPPPDRRRAIWTVAIVAGLVGVAGGIGVVAMRSSGAPAAAAPAATTVAAPATTTATATVSATASATAAATASATASASAAPSASIEPHKPAAHPNVAPPTTKPTSAAPSGPPRAWD
jgi:serine/threonine-protein kinase